jgi:hypothetical protein
MKSSDGMTAVGWMSGILCSVTVDRSHIITGQLERKPIQPLILQVASGEIIPVLKEALVELTGVERVTNVVVCL